MSQVPLYVFIMINNSSNHQETDVRNLFAICDEAGASSLTDESACEIFKSRQWQDKDFYQLSTDLFKNTPILYAIATGKVNLAHLLAEEMMKRGGDVASTLDQTDGWSEECGNTPLSLAIKMGYEDLALTLLNSGLINIKHQFPNNYSYLHFAGIFRMDFVETKLVELGIDTTLKNKFGITAAEYRAYQFTDLDFESVLPHFQNYCVIPDLNGLLFHKGYRRAIEIPPHSLSSSTNSTLDQHIFENYRRRWNSYRQYLNTTLAEKLADRLRDTPNCLNTLRECVQEGLIASKTHLYNKMKRSKSELTGTQLESIFTYKYERESNKNEYSSWFSRFFKLNAYSRTAKLEAAQQIITAITDNTFNPQQVPEAAKNGKLSRLIRP